MVYDSMPYYGPGEIFECDPNKNKECDKSSCWFNKMAVLPVCHSTSHEAYKWDGKKKRKVKDRRSKDAAE